MWYETCHGKQYSMIHHLSTTKLQINQSCLLATVSEINGKCWLCQEIKDDGILPETCHDHNNHAAAAISLTRSEWGMAEVRLNKDVFSYQEAALNMSVYCLYIPVVSFDIYVCLPFTTMKFNFKMFADIDHV